MNKKDELVANIQLLKDLNMKPNISELARAYDLDRRTVKKYFEAGEVPARKKKKEFSKWDQYEESIEKMLQVPGVSIRAIHRHFLETMGEDKVPGTYESLKAFVKKKGFKKTSD
ncbi:hypothetical protein IM774_04095 [Erysipelotrichaceae bacterium RD49]|nr:hypothetical protein [Erysipelotrichaceae bacterium RD49]